MAVAKRNVADKKRKPARGVQVEVRVGALYYDDGRSYPQGAIVEVSAADAKVLQGRGEVGKPGSLKREAEQAEAEAEKRAAEQAEAAAQKRSRRAGGSRRSGLVSPDRRARASTPARPPAPDASDLASFGSTARP